MHGQIDRLVEQRDFEFLGEDALAAHLGQGNIGDAVPFVEMISTATSTSGAVYNSAATWQA